MINFYIDQKTKDEIFQAIKNSNIEKFRELLNNLKEIQIKHLSALSIENKWGNTSLLGYVAQNNHLEILKLLFQFKAVKENANAKNNEVLRHAALFGRLEIVKEVLGIKAVNDSAAALNNQALRDAAKNGHFDIVRVLLEIKSVKKNAVTANNEALRLAARFGHHKVVRELLKINKVRVAAAVKNNEALCVAAEEGIIKVVQELLKIDAVRDNAAVKQNLALRKAIENGHVEVVLALLKIAVVKNNAHLDDNFALCWATANGFLEIVQELLKIEDVKNNAASLANEAFRGAAKNGHLEIVIELLKIEAVKANATAENNEALIYAAENGHHKVVEELLKLDDVKASAAFDQNYALCEAASNGYHKVVRALLLAPAVCEYLLREDGKQLIEILQDTSVDSAVFKIVFNTLEVYGIPLSQVIDKKSQNLFKDIKFYCAHSEIYLEQKTNFSLSQRQAVRIFKSYHDVASYELMVSAMEQWQNPDDEKKIAGVMNHYETVIAPKFAVAFEKYGKTLDERLQNVESAIRGLLLGRIKEAAKVKQDLIVINFIDNNFNVLITGQDKNLMQEAREHFNSNVINEHVAWRAYDQWAPCVKEWPNLLTPLLEKGDEKIYSVDVLGRKVDANSASSILRKLVAVSFCLVMDESIENVATLQDRIENFIGQLKDIRRAHNNDNTEEDDAEMDNPSCYPGTVSRVGLMWAMHSLALSKRTLELLPEILKAKVSSAFNMALEQCSDQAQRDVLYCALVMLRKENALDVIIEKADFSHESDWALMRQAFVDSLGTYGELWDEVNKELAAIGVENKLTLDQQVYLLQYLADIGGGWSAEALTSIYRQHDEKMKIEEEIIAQAKEERQVSNPYSTFKGMPEKIAQMRAKQFAAWEIIYPLLAIHSDNATGELADLAKVIVKGWVESENKSSELLELNPFDQEEFDFVSSNETLIEIVSRAYHVANTKLEEVVETAPLTTAYDNQKKRRHLDGKEKNPAKRAKNDDVDESSEYRFARR